MTVSSGKPTETTNRFKERNVSYEEVWRKKQAGTNLIKPCFEHDGVS